MATFTKRNAGWLCQVRRKGHKAISRTFDSKADAERWALSIESSMGVGTYIDNREVLATTLGECFSRYSREITPLKKSAKRESERIAVWLRDPIASRPIGTIRQADVALWRDAKLASGLSGTTVTKELALLSHVFNIAIKEWGYQLTNPVTLVRKPKINPGRERRLEGNEEQRLLGHCNYELKAWVIIAIETAMRRSEIHGLQRNNIKGKVAYLPDTKNGLPRSVPLSTTALAAINSLPVRISGKLWEYDPAYYTFHFSRACKMAGIEGLRLHDLRHEATSRLFERGFSLIEVASITGHRSLQMLNRYTHYSADRLAEKLG